MKINTTTLLPDLAEVSRGRTFLSQIAEEAGFPDERVFDIAVACSEAMANAIEHSPVKGEVQVRAVLHEDRLEVEIQGPGEFQAPDRLRQSNRGLGLPLMAKLSDHLALFSGPGEQTFVSLTFYRPGAAPSARAAGAARLDAAPPAAAPEPTSPGAAPLRATAPTPAAPAPPAAAEAPACAQPAGDGLIRLALRGAPVALAAQDKDLRYIWRYDQRVSEGVEFVGKTDYDLFPEQADLLTIIKRDVMKTGISRRQQLWHDGPVGRLFIDLYCEPMRDEQGAVTGVLVAAVDMTEQRLVEEAFRRSEVQLTYLVMLDDAMGGLEDPDEMLATAVRMLGIKLDADRVFYREFPEQGEGEFYTVERDYHKSGIPSAVGRYELKEDVEAIRKEYESGKTLWTADAEADESLSSAQRERLRSMGVRAHIGVPLVAQGRLKAALCVWQLSPREWNQEEIWLVQQTAERTWGAVERARAVASLRERQRELDLAMRAGRVVPYEIDLVGRGVKASPGLFALFGLEPDAELLSMDDWGALMHPDDLGSVQSSVRRSRISGVEHHLEYRVIYPDGSVHWHETHAAPVLGADGRYARLVGYATDITERKRIEEALRESEERYRLIADHLQAALLDIPAEIGPLKLGHLYHSATEAARVGGDFYDVFQVKRGKIGVLIGDVSGHGIQAARTATLVKDVIRAFAHQSVRPSEVVKRTNSMLVEKGIAGFVTVFLGILDPQTGDFRYTSAGHPETMLRRANGEVLSLGTGAFPLGIFADASWKTGIAELEAGDILLLYTDGVLEARRNREMFGQQRLEALLRRKRVNVRRLPHMVLDQVLAFSQGTLHDDVAVLALCLTEKAPRAGQPFSQESLLDQLAGPTC